METSSIVEHVKSRISATPVFARTVAEIASQAPRGMYDMTGEVQDELEFAKQMIAQSSRTTRWSLHGGLAPTINMLERSASKGNFDDVLATSGAGNAEAASGATHGETRESRSRHDSQGDGGSPDAGKRTTLYSSTASLLKVRDKFTDFRPAWRTGFAHRKEWVAPVAV